MKKLIILLLAAVLMVSSAIPAYADEKTEAEKTVYDENGITLVYPEEFSPDKLKGTFSPSPRGVLAGFGVGVMAFDYVAIPAQELTAISERSGGEFTPEDSEYLRSKWGTLATVYSIDGGRSLEDFLAMKESADIPADEIYEIGKAGEVTFFFRSEPEGRTEEYLQKIAPVYQEEYITLRKALEEALKNAEYAEPSVPGSILVGSTLDFETVDVDGNPVRSIDLFRKNKITMINFWTTTCINCRNEMADLVEINKRLAEKNAAIIGVCLDADTEPEACREIVEEYKIDFPTLLPFFGAEEALDIRAFPTSYFVDSEGTILSVPYVGAPVDRSRYENYIDSLLNGEEVAQENLNPVAENNGETYRVIVSNTGGDPVKGVMVEFCSDTTCRFEKTDQNGVAEFAAENGVYTVHILKVPKGYVKPNEEYRTEENYCDVYYVLQNAE